MNEKIYNSIIEVKKFIEEANESGLNLNNVLKRITEAIELLNTDTITIALLGRFSDGKTTVISGLIGKLMDNMKIDANESSDEIIFYESDFLGKKFKFVDTPGLFGQKEKTYEGEGKKKFSSLTEEYISKANIVIYVTEVSNPLPESHQETLRHIMRDLRKLDNSLFIINKMDQKYDMTDDFEYNDGTKIKTENLKERLTRCLNLSGKERDNLKIICIAADPKGKGLNHWFDNKEKYLEKSKIYLLESYIKDFTQNILEYEIHI